MLSFMNMGSVVSTDSSSSWPSRLEWVLIVAFWGTLALLSAGQELFEDGRGGLQWGTMGRDVIEYLMWAGLTPLLFRFTEGTPVERSTASMALPLHVAVALVTSIGIDLGEDVILAGFVPDAYPPVGPFAQVWRLWFLDELFVYLIVVMAGFARSYYFQKQERQREAERLEKRAQALEAQLTEARLEALRMQLNPHFLFNTLHAVSTLVDRDPDGVRRMIARLSELLRHVLDEEAPQEVPLSQELDFLDDYLEIQTIRFRGRLDVTIDVPPALRDAQVPNLILQPIVENAIKHGASQVRGVGEIEIQAQRNDDRLAVTVRDNGPGPPEDVTNGVGLQNVRARLRELYGSDHTLSLHTAEEGGTITLLELPYHTSTDLYTAAGTSSDASSPVDESLE